jgi:hypothetical protein
LHRFSGTPLGNGGDWLTSLNYWNTSQLTGSFADSLRRKAASVGGPFAVQRFSAYVALEAVDLAHRPPLELLPGNPRGEIGQLRFALSSS